MSFTIPQTFLANSTNAAALVRAFFFLVFVLFGSETTSVAFFNLLTVSACMSVCVYYVQIVGLVSPMWIIGFVASVASSANVTFRGAFFAFFLIFVGSFTFFLLVSCCFAHFC